MIHLKRFAIGLGLLLWVSLCLCLTISIGCGILWVLVNKFFFVAIAVLLWGAYGAGKYIQEDTGGNLK